MPSLRARFRNMCLIRLSFECLNGGVTVEYIRAFYATVTGKYPENQSIPSFMPGKQ